MQKSVRTEQQENRIKILKAGKPVGQCELDARVLRKDSYHSKEGSQNHRIHSSDSPDVQKWAVAVKVRLKTGLAESLNSSSKLVQPL